MMIGMSLVAVEVVELVAVEFVINNAYQQSIGTKPFRLTYEQNPLTPVSLRIHKIENPAALAGEIAEGQVVSGRSTATPESICRSTQETCRL